MKLQGTRSIVRSGSPVLVALGIAVLTAAAAARPALAVSAGNRVIAIGVLSSSRGWVLLEDRLLWSDDDGASWRDDALVAPPETRLQAAQFLDGLLGWVVAAAAGDAEVLLTTDAGSTWNRASIPMPGDEGPAGASLSFVDESTGFLMLRLPASRNLSRGALFRTDDGGRRWQWLPTPPSGGQIRFVSTQHGWLAGGPADGDLFVTRDGGRSWDPARVPDASSIALDDTHDGGFSWTVLASDVRGVPSTGLLELGDQTAMTTGSNVTVVTAAVAAEIGKVRLPPGFDLTALSFADSRRGWVAADAGRCARFETGCWRETRILRTREGASSLEDVTPRRVLEANRDAEARARDLELRPAEAVTPSSLSGIAHTGATPGASVHPHGAAAGAIAQPRRTTGDGNTAPVQRAGSATSLIGAEAPCLGRVYPGRSGPQVQEASAAGTTISRTEGNLSERVDLSRIASTSGATVALTAVYASYNADGSRAKVDTVMGPGWTHSYNVFLFSQLDAIFRFDGEGRVTRYAPGPGGAYTAAPGYFETLVKDPGGSLTLTQKDKTSLSFAAIAGTPFLVGSSTWRLTAIVDRNGNRTTLTYTGGNLTKITDTYGRSLTLAYDSQQRLASITDLAGRITRLRYDAVGRRLIELKDPDGKTIEYSYNDFNQLVGKVDKGRRSFSYAYVDHEPVAASDGAGSARATLSNPDNWATDPAALAASQRRVYRPSTTSKTDGRGNVWQYGYDANGYLTSVMAPDRTTTTYRYDPGTLMLAAQTDANGHATTYQYDAQGNEVGMTDAAGHATAYTYEPVFNMMTSVTDPRGRTTTYGYDARGNRVRETDPLGKSRRWAYDPHGNAVRQTDKNGHTTTYRYDGSGNRTATIDPLGNVTTMTYDAVGNVLSRTDPNLRTTSFQYDPLNRVVRVIDPAGKSTQTGYDGDGSRVKITDRNSHSTTIVYDLRRRPVRIANALARPETYAYDGNDNLIAMTDRDLHTTIYDHDAQDRLTQRTDALANVTKTTHDPAGNVLTQTDANGHTAAYAYDALNRRIAATNAVGGTTRFGYDTGTLAGCGAGADAVAPRPCGGVTPGSRLVTAQTDADGKVIYVKYDDLDRKIAVVRKVGATGDTMAAADAITTYGYDAVGNLETIREPDGNVTAYQYDANNRRTRETNAAGDVTITAYDGASNAVGVTAPDLNVTTNTFDANNHLTAIRDSIGAVAGYTYDAGGNRLSETDGNGNTTATAYDALDRPILSTDALGKTTTLEYDAVGNLVKITDRDANVTLHAYDAINRPVSTTNALGNVTRYQYDAPGNLLEMTDGNDHATQYAYDANNRRIEETYADGKTYHLTYDGAGNPLTRTDQAGLTTRYEYSDLYDLLRRSHPDGVNDNYTYDGSGRMLTAERAGWLVTFAYDGADRVTEAVQDGHAVSYGYDIPGRTRRITYPGGRVITEHGDARERLVRTDDAGSPLPIAQYSYDGGDRVLNRRYRNGTATAYGYNANDWVVGSESSGPGFASPNDVPVDGGAGRFLAGTRIVGFGYGYDDMGNKRFEDKLHDRGHSEAYRYDDAYRLVDFQVGALGGATVPDPRTEVVFGLDTVGNWNTVTATAGPGANAAPVKTQTRQHNAVNEVVKVDTAKLTYDANGNLHTDARYVYGFDAENRLVEVTRKADSAVVGSYTYDALGRRVAKGAAVPGTFYFYDDDRIVEESDSAGATQATYVYGNYVDEVLTMDRGGHTLYYHQNALWSVAALTTGAGGVAERYRYDAYGLPAVTDGAGAPVPADSSGTPQSAVGNPWMFSGRQFDEETGLYLYRTRYLDPAQGRFISRDPIGIWEDSANLGNGYAYVGDQPTNATDPTGEDGGSSYYGPRGGGGSRSGSSGGRSSGGGGRSSAGGGKSSSGGGRSSGARGSGSTSGYGRSPKAAGGGGSYYGPRTFGDILGEAPTPTTCCRDGWNGWGFVDHTIVNYGNWCGPGGNGTPIDELDTCCKGHDCCMHDAVNAQTGWNLFIPSIDAFACDRDLQICALKADCRGELGCNTYRAGLVILFFLPFNII